MMLIRHAFRLCVGVVFLVLLGASCSDDEPVANAVTLALVSPDADGVYVESVPLLLAIAAPALNDAAQSAVTALVNGKDVSSNLTVTERSIVSSLPRSALREGSNSVVVALGEQTHAVNFEWQPCAEPPCETATPIIGGPANAVEMQQASLYGTGFGKPSDERRIIVNGASVEWVGGHFGEDWLMFVAPPAEVGTIEIVVEVNGVASEPFTMQIDSAPALERSVDEVLDDFEVGLKALRNAHRALAVPALDDSELQDSALALNSALSDVMDAQLVSLESQLDSLDPEGRELLAQFVAQGALDTLLSEWVDGVPQLEAGMNASLVAGACGRDVLVMYKLISYLSLVQDAVNGLSVAMLIASVFVPTLAPAAVTMIKFSAQLSFYIGNLTFALSVLLPKPANATIDLPAVVGTDETVTVSGQVEWTYDLSDKKLAIANWAANQVMNKNIGDGIGAAGFADNITELIGTAFGKAVNYANGLAKKLKDGTPVEKFPAEADPTYLGFDAPTFVLENSGDPEDCTARGHWPAGLACEKSEKWSIGWYLATTSVSDVLFSKNMQEGTVATSSSVLADGYDDETYGAWIENFGSNHGCDAIASCWVDFFARGNCNPGLRSLSCNEMS